MQTQYVVTFVYLQENGYKTDNRARTVFFYCDLVYEPWQRNRNEEAALYTVAVATTLTWGGTVGPLWVSVVIMASSCNGIDLHTRACSLLNYFSRYQQPARPGGKKTHTDFFQITSWRDSLITAVQTCTLRVYACISVWAGCRESHGARWEPDPVWERRIAGCSLFFFPPSLQSSCLLVPQLPN